MRIKLFTTVRTSNPAFDVDSYKDRSTPPVLAEVLTKTVTLRYPVDVEAMLHVQAGHTIFRKYRVHDVSLLRLDITGEIDVGIEGYREPSIGEMRKRVRALIEDGWMLRVNRPEIEARP